MTATVPAFPAFAAIEAALRRPTHAYLLVGREGWGTADAARALAAGLIAPDDLDVARRVRAGIHPDVREWERDGASLAIRTVRELLRVAVMSPQEGRRRVTIVHDVHLLTPDAATTLLKTLEEPPPSSTFILLADDITTDMTTIVSRCAVIAFGPLATEEIVSVLEQEGVESGRAALAAEAAEGDLERARLLASDDGLAVRRHAWRELPHRLDRTGATAVREAERLLGMIEEAAGALAARHAHEREELDARLEATAGRRGERGARKDLEERHRRELRRHRTDELLAGLATLAGAYRDLLIERGRPEYGEAVATIQALLTEWVRNPNEQVQLQALFLRLPPA